MVKIQLTRIKIRSNISDIRIRIIIKEMEHSDFDTIASFKHSFKNRIEEIKPVKGVYLKDLCKFLPVSPDSIALWKTNLKGDLLYMIYLINFIKT